MGFEDTPQPLGKGRGGWTRRGRTGWLGEQEGVGPGSRDRSVSCGRTAVRGPLGGGLVAGRWPDSGVGGPRAWREAERAERRDRLSCRFPLKRSRGTTEKSKPIAGSARNTS